MKFSAFQIATLINGTIEGDGNTTVSSFAKIEEVGPGQISFFANAKYEDYLYQSQASIIIINHNFQLKHTVKATLIKVEDAYTAFALLLTKYQETMQQDYNGIEQPVFISPKAQIGKNVYIGAFSYISDYVVIGDNTKIFPQTFLGKNVSIGNNCQINAGVKIYEQCKLGNSVIIHAGTIIGSDGFGFAPQSDGSFQKIPQLGNVIIEDDVEIGANATIDRATMGSTLIKKGAKLDNLIQIAHNVEVGRFTVVAAQAGISGSTKIGNGVMIGGQAGIVGHIQLGDGAKVNAQSGVTKSIEEGHAVTGSPAQEYTLALRQQVSVRKLPGILSKLANIEEQLQHILAEKEANTEL